MFTKKLTACQVIPNIMKKNNSKKKIREIKKPRVKEIKKQKDFEIKKETLEEHIEDSEIIENNEFHQFLNSPPSQNISPVLEKIQKEEETDLESNIISTPLSRTTSPQENITTNYSASQNYMGSNYNETGRGYAQVESISLVLDRTRVSDDISKKELLKWQDVQAREHSFVENTERINIRNIEERKALPFEKTEKKYKEFKR